LKIVSDEMKTSPIRLGDDEAVERIAVKCGKRRKGENVSWGQALWNSHRLHQQVAAPTKHWRDWWRISFLMHFIGFIQDITTLKRCCLEATNPRDCLLVLLATPEPYL